MFNQSQELSSNDIDNEDEKEANEEYFEDIS